MLFLVAVVGPRAVPAGAPAGAAEADEAAVTSRARRLTRPVRACVQPT